MEKQTTTVKHNGKKTTTTTVKHNGKTNNSNSKTQW
jgi:hypothetical protein